MKRNIYFGLKHILLSVLLGLLTTQVQAEVAVIVNPANSANVDLDTIAKIYLGKTKKFDNGTSVVALDRAEGSDLRIKFLQHVVGKEEAQMKSYWSRLIFTGNGVPPKIVESDEEVKDLVSRNPDIIGYIDSGSVDDSVKVVTKF